MSPRPTVAAYYFPNYHRDAKNEAVHGSGWTEWDLVRHARPRFANHQQPKVPLWGYEDEADPAVMTRKIDAAADHGVDAFIFDWYWHDQGAYLARCLDEGYLHAENRERTRFALMWANHDWIDIHPAKAGQVAPLQWGGAVSETTWENLTDHIVARYFRDRAYWRIDGAPYFSVYELFRLVQSFGSVAGCRLALDRFRAKAQRAGMPDIHFNAVVWGVQILPGEQSVKNPGELVEKLGFSSVTSYVWVHNVQLPEFPVTDYAWVTNEAAAQWGSIANGFRQPYHPNVTMGWDASPRTVLSDVFRSAGYPFMATIGGNTPARFREALARAQAWRDARGQGASVITLNAWNEWTEGSYLEPDTINGYGYLEAIRSVFGRAGAAAG